MGQAEGGDEGGGIVGMGGDGVALTGASAVATAVMGDAVVAGGQALHLVLPDPRAATGAMECSENTYSNPSTS